MILMLFCAALPTAGQTHWRAERPISNNLFQFRAISSADSLHAVAVGFDGFYYGRAVRTTDGGRTWSEVFKDSNKVIDGTLIKSLRLYDVAHPTPEQIIIIADSVIDYRDGSVTRERLRGIILRSTDGGVSWASTVLDSGMAAYGISMVNPQQGLVRAVGSMLHTTDGGVSWVRIPYPDSAIRAATDLQAITPTIWIVYTLATEDPTAFRTTDAGATWASSIGEIPLTVTSIHFIDTLFGWGVGGNKKAIFDPEQSVIAHTTDGGMTWTEQFKEVVGEAGSGLQDVAFIDRQRGRAVGQYGTLLRTENGGQTWEVEHTGVTPAIGFAHYYAIAWPAEETVMITVMNGYLLRYHATALPAPPVIVSPENRSEGQPLSVTIEWTPVPDAIAYHLQVSAGDASFVTGIVVDDSSIVETSHVLKDLSANTTYAVRLRTITATDTSNWSSLLEQHTFTTGTGTSSVAIDEAARSMQVRLWPNPAGTDRLRVHVAGNAIASEQMLCRMYDLYGRLVLERSLPSDGTGASLQIDGVPAGSYQLVVEQGGKRGVARVVVVR
jgi:photosystem II stability/assembly factor-like uncharacterized protein